MSEVLLAVARGGLLAAQVAPRAMTLLASHGRWALAADTTSGPAGTASGTAASTTAASGAAATTAAAGNTTGTASTALTTNSAPSPQTATAPVGSGTAPAAGALTTGSSSADAAAVPSPDSFPTLLLSALVWSSLAIGLVVLLLPSRTAEDRGRIRILGLVGTGFPLLLALIGVNVQMNRAAAATTPLAGDFPTYEEHHSWITSFPVHIDYHMAVDGVSLPLLLLSTILFFVAVIASWRVQSRIRFYVFLLLLLETGVNGTFCAYDLALFTIFQGVEIVPMFLLIGIWGGSGGPQAARRFLVAGLVSTSALVMMVVLVGFKAGVGSFAFLDVAGGNGGIDLTVGLAQLCFWLAFVAFAVRLPVVPFHTWALSANEGASAPVSMLMSGVLVKIGGYGLLRICVEGFPEAAHHFSLVLAVLAAVGSVWATVCALAQDDIRRLIAYTGIGQMALVLLAVSAQRTIALDGAVLEMFAQGLSIGMLVLLAGLLEDRTKTRRLSQMGGLAWQMPKLATLWIFAALASVGVPLLAGFAAEFDIFVGAFPEHRVATVVVMASTVIMAAYLVWTTERILFGSPREAFARVRDAAAADMLSVVPLAVVSAVVGVFGGRLLPVIAGGVASITIRLSGFQ